MVTKNFRVKIILHGIHRELKEVAKYIRYFVEALAFERD